VNDSAAGTLHVVRGGEDRGRYGVDRCTLVLQLQLLMSNEEPGEGSSLAKCDADGLGMLVTSMRSRVNQKKHCRIAGNKVNA
jgi:hypothetical protein